MQWDMFNTQNHIAIPQCIAMPQYNIAIPQGKSSNYRNPAIQYRHTARQIFQLSLCRNTISPYRKANLPIIAIPQYNIAIPQGYYRHTARQDFQLSQCRNTIKKRI